MIFGRDAVNDGGFAQSFDLADLNGTNGFVLNGAAFGDRAGISVSAAGDVNGDGIADILIGANGADPNNIASGATYLVFGKETDFSASFDLSALNGSNGYILNGIDWGDNSGASVSSAGDVNGDGVDDILIGAYSATPNGASSGEAYVVFGGEANLAALDGDNDGKIDLVDLNGTNGFVLKGIAVEDRAGWSVS